MPYSTLTGFNVDSSSNDGEQYQMWEIGSGYVLTGVDVVGGFNSTTQAISANDEIQLYNTILAGFQLVPTSGTPASLTSDLDSSQWLWNGFVEPAPGPLAYPLTTSYGNAYLERYPYRYRWRGQLPITTNSYGYFSTTGYDNPITGTKPTWFFMGSVRGYYSVAT